VTLRPLVAEEGMLVIRTLFAFLFCFDLFLVMDVFATGVTETLLVRGLSLFIIGDVMLHVFLRGVLVDFFVNGKSDHW